MKLYQYHHCPYCVRADMVANYKNVKHEKVFLLNDDEASCYQLIGAKMVPILQFDDQTAMAESLDIVAKLDALGDAQKILAPQVNASTFTDRFASVNDSVRRLLYPRNLMINLPEFATSSACEYFKSKKEKMIGMSFDDAFAASQHDISVVNNMLSQLPELPISDNLSMDDVLVFPVLRNLTQVKGLVFPPQVKIYILHIAALTGVDTYFACAV